jgi:hypothetical protein
MTENDGDLQFTEQIPFELEIAELSPAQLKLRAVCCHLVGREDRLSVIENEARQRQDPELINYVAKLIGKERKDGTR